MADWIEEADAILNVAVWASVLGTWPQAASPEPQPKPRPEEPFESHIFKELMVAKLWIILGVIALFTLLGVILFRTLLANKRSRPHLSPPSARASISSKYSHQDRESAWSQQQIELADRVSRASSQGHSPRNSMNSHVGIQQQPQYDFGGLSPRGPQPKMAPSINSIGRYAGRGQQLLVSPAANVRGAHSFTSTSDAPAVVLSLQY